MNAHRIAGELEVGAYMFTGLLMNGIQRAADQNRIRRAEAAAADGRMASAVMGSSSRAHAVVASDLRVQLIGAESEISRLRDLVEDLRHERTGLITVAADLLTENEILRARH